MSLLNMSKLTHSFGENLLYKEASFTLFKEEHVGLVGKNGAGKSTLMKIMIGEVLPDEGTINWQRNSRFGYLDQFVSLDPELVVKDYLYESFSELVALEQKMIDLYSQSVEGDTEALLIQAANCQTELESSGFYQIDNRVQQTIKGLGIDELDLELTFSELNEGQRAKIILGRLLLDDPDVLLLDEPTNFLDRGQTEWLVAYLRQFSGAFIVISHDTDFLENVSTTICDVDFGVIKKYSGNYSAFIKQKEHLVADYTRQYEAQQKKIQETEAFIRKNIAGINTKMAQGRRKHLERMEKMTKLTTKKTANIQLRDSDLRSKNALLLKDLAVGYSSTLLNDLILYLSNRSKCVLTGQSGVGKTTLLKTIVGQLAPISGDIKVASQARISYYEQSQKWLDDQQTPVAIISDSHPTLTIEEVRKKLVEYGVEAHHVEQAVGTLSGGEQAKVRLCDFVLKDGNFLILDDPTSHLDVATKAVLEQALRSYQGPVLLVSNDVEFYENWATEVLELS